MPTTPFASVQASINGGAQRQGGLFVNYNDIIQLTGTDTSNWTNQIWEITYFPIGYATPAGWTLSSDGLTLSSTSVVPPPFSMPAAALWGKWMIRLRINDALINEKAPIKFTDLVTTLSIESNNGLRDLGRGETTQYGTGWDTDHQRNLRQIDAGISGGGGGGGTLIGDASGPVGANSVLKIHGATVPIAGGLTTGNVLQVTGTSALSYAPVNLAGGANYVTGALPIGNLAPGTVGQIFATAAGPVTAWQTAGGDVTGAPTAFVVGKIRGATVGTAAGALVTGQALRVTGASTIDYGAIDLANTNAVTGLLAIARIAPGTSGQFFVTNATPAATWATAAGDWTGAVTANVVGRINGATVPAAGALTTSHLLKVSGASALTYGFVVDANVDPAAAIVVTKLAPGANNTTLITNGAGAIVWSTTPPLPPSANTVQIVANMPALEALSTTSLSDVVLCIVQSPRGLYSLNKTPADAPVNGTSGSMEVPSANPTGRWDFVMAL